MLDPAYAALQVAAIAYLLGQGATRVEANTVLEDLKHVMVPDTASGILEQLDSALDRLRARKAADG